MTGPLLILTGTLLILGGILLIRRNRDFDALLDLEEDGEPSRLDRIEQLIELQGQRIERMEQRPETVDYRTQSVEEITRITGMKKGEVLLLKRLMEESDNSHS